MADGEKMELNLLTLGDSAVGKTCLLLRYSDDTFEKHFMTTIGIDFKSKELTLEDSEGVSRDVQLRIWDTAGQERFRTITTSYIRGADGVLLVYDITDPNTFSSMRYWVEQIKKGGGEALDMVLVGAKADLLDNEQYMKKLHDKVGCVAVVPPARCDSPAPLACAPARALTDPSRALASSASTSTFFSSTQGDKYVTTEEGQALAEEFNVPFFETSAKTNKNVDAAFLALANATLKTKLRREEQDMAGSGGSGSVGVSSGGGKAKAKCC
jgi:small GTP-binding protein